MKKLLSLILAAMMLGSCMAGCAQNDSDSGNGSEGEDGPIKLVVYNNSGVITSTEASDPEIIQQVHDWLLEETGYDVTIITPTAEDDATELNLKLSGGDQIDLFWGDWTTYAKSGAIIPVNEYLDSKGADIVAAWPQEAWDAMTDTDGQIYGIPRSTPVSGNPLWVRTDWCEQFGMGGCVLPLFHLIPGARNDLAVLHRDGADRDLVRGGGNLRQAQRLPHKKFIVPALRVDAVGRIVHSFVPFFSSALMRMEQKSGPHIVQKRLPCCGLTEEASSARFRYSRARSGSSARSNCLSQSNWARA